MAKGTDESGNEKRKVDKMSLFERLLDPDYDSTKDTLRTAKELAAAKAEDRESSSAFNHPEYMELAEFAAEEGTLPNIVWRKREDR